MKRDKQNTPGRFRGSVEQRGISGAGGDALRKVYSLRLRGWKGLRTDQWLDDVATARPQTTPMFRLSHSPQTGLSEVPRPHLTCTKGIISKARAHSCWELIIMVRGLPNEKDPDLVQL